VDVIQQRDMENSLNRVELRELALHEIPSAAGVLSRGMRDNPIHIQVFGEDARQRERALRLMFVPVLRQQMRKGVVLGAFISGELAGVTGMVPPKHCQPTVAEKVTVLPALIRGGGLRSFWRILEWVGDWSRHDAAISHWHLGPIAVDRALQGMRIGSALLGEICRRIDGHRSAGYLETDKPGNVIFYKRFGFYVVDEHPVLGIMNWFMVRNAVVITSVDSKKAT
jgi:ribosomal protein S18 acetylase RimI-like enzyme